MLAGVFAGFCLIVVRWVVGLLQPGAPWGRRLADASEDYRLSD